jgi:hypothetical protein
MTSSSSVARVAKASALYTKYGTRLEKESAAEQLAKRVEAAPPATKASAPTERKAAKPAGNPLIDFLGSRQGKTLQNEVIRGAFSLLRKRM